MVRYFNGRHDFYSYVLGYALTNINIFLLPVQDCNVCVCSVLFCDDGRAYLVHYLPWAWYFLHCP